MLPETHLCTYFETVEDPRIERTKEHLWLNMIAITVCMVVCGAGQVIAIDDRTLRHSYDSRSLRHSSCHCHGSNSWCHAQFTRQLTMIDLALNALVMACTPTPQAKLIPLDQISRPGPPSAEEREVERRATTWGELMRTDAKRQISGLKLNLKPEHIVYVMKMRTVWDSDFREENGLFYPTSKKISFYYWVFDAEVGKTIAQYK